MKHVRLGVSADGHESEIHPMYDLMANAPFVERATALQWNPADGALGILHFVKGDPDPFEAAIADVPEVLGYELEPVGEESFYVYVRDATTESLREMFGSLTTGGLVIVPPIVYHGDGSVTLSLFGPDDELQAAVDGIPDPVDVVVEEVSGLESTAAAVDARLTERQRQAAETALELGYYDVPRTASHEDVAERLGCAPSTAAEHLRKAEATLVESALRTG